MNNYNDDINKLAESMCKMNNRLVEEMKNFKESIENIKNYNNSIDEMRKMNNNNNLLEEMKKLQENYGYYTKEIDEFKKYIIK